MHNMKNIIEQYATKPEPKFDSQSDQICYNNWFLCYETRLEPLDF